MIPNDLCPRCGLPSEPGEVVCPACGWLLSNRNVPPQYRMSSSRVERAAERVIPQDGQSSTDDSETSSETAREEGFSQKRPRGFVSAKALAVTLIITLPLAFLGGMATLLRVASHQSAQTASPQTQIVTKTVPGPTRYITKTVTVPGPVRTVTKTVDVPTFPVPKLINVYGASAQYPNVIRGATVNNALRTTLWISTSEAGPYHPVTAEIDTGSQQTLVNGGLMQAFGDPPSGATESLYGIAGSGTVDFYDHVWVWAYPNGEGAPLVAGDAEPAGLGHSSLGMQGVELDIGQSVLDMGTLIQMGADWQFQYQPQ